MFFWFPGIWAAATKNKNARTFTRCQIKWPPTVAFHGAVRSAARPLSDKVMVSVGIWTIA